MDLIKNWQQIIEQNDEKAIIPFLKQLNEVQKKTLLPHLSKLAKEYLEIKDRVINDKHFYAKKASNKQERILNYTIFVVIPSPQHPLHKWLKTNKLINNYAVNHLFNWYCPLWFIKLLNNLGQKKSLPLSITYDLVQTMSEQGYFQPSKLLIGRLLPKMIFPELPKEKSVHFFDSQILLNRPITLKEHFWYLFKFESQIYDCEKYLNFKDKGALPKNCWYHTILQYVKNGKINRLKLLKACLSTVTNQSLNKRTVGWFMELFECLNPAEKEIIQLQKSLYQTFLSSNSKANNIALKNIKKIIHLSEFYVADCLKDFDTLLTSSTKSVVKNALIILDKIAHYYPAKNKKISALAAKSLSLTDEDLQVKAAHIIKKCGKKNSQHVVETIGFCKNYLFQSTLKILDEFALIKKIHQTKNLPRKSPKTKKLNRQSQIPIINNFTDFHLLSLKIFKQEQPFHFEQFLANLLKFHAQIKGKNIEKFTPIFKQCYQLVFNELPSNQGMLDNILAIFLMDFANLLINKHPEDSQSLQKLTAFYINQGFFINSESQPFELEFTHLYRWYNPYDPSKVYMPFKKLLAIVLTFLHQKKSLPLLSTPTHKPSWIDPQILIKRVAVYQQNEEIPDPLDLQLAISRTAFENTSKAIQLAKSCLKKEYLALIQFLLEPEAKYPAKLQSYLSSSKGELIETPPFFYSFVTASITKNVLKQSDDFSQLPDLKIPKSYFNGNHNWMVFWEERWFEEWNPKTQLLEYVGNPYIHREIQVKFSKGLDVKKHPDFLYQYFPGNDEAFRPNVNDVQCLLGMLPNNPGPLVALLVADNLKYSTFWGKDARIRAHEMLKWLHQYNHQSLGQAVHLFLSTCLLCADKNIRLSAAEFWKKAIVQKTINSELLGQFIGKMERKDFVPLKRFIDLAYKQLFNISDIHNQALETIIANILAKLPAIPLRNLKLLLSLYRELLILNKSKITKKRLRILLALWQKSASLKKVINELIYYAEYQIKYLN